MGKNTGKVREVFQSDDVGTMRTDRQTDTVYKLRILLAGQAGVTGLSYPQDHHTPL